MPASKPDRNPLLAGPEPTSLRAAARRQGDSLLGPPGPPAGSPPDGGTSRLSKHERVLLDTRGVWLATVLAVGTDGTLSVEDAAGSVRSVQDHCSESVVAGDKVACVFERDSTEAGAAVGVQPASLPAGFPPDFFKCQTQESLDITPIRFGQVVEDTAGVLGFGAGALVVANGKVAHEEGTGFRVHNGVDVSVFSPSGARLHTFPKVTAELDVSIIRVEIWDGRLFVLTRNDTSSTGHSIFAWEGTAWRDIGTAIWVFFTATYIVLLRGTNSAGVHRWLHFLAAGEKDFTPDTVDDPVTANVRVTTWWAHVGDGRVWSESVSENTGSNYESTETKQLLPGAPWSTAVASPFRNGQTPRDDIDGVLYEVSPETNGWALRSMDSAMAVTLLDGDIFVGPQPVAVSDMWFYNGILYATGTISGEAFGAASWVRIPVVWKRTTAGLEPHWVGFEYAAEGAVAANLKPLGSSTTDFLVTLGLTSGSPAVNEYYYRVIKG